jgi:PAS domain S-box-containing protein
MSIRFKLILPTALILVLAVGLALWQHDAPARWMATAAALMVCGQWLAHERWAVRPLRAARTAAQAAAQREQAALEQAASQSRRVEEALRWGEERYVAAVRGASDGLWEWDLAAQRVLISPRWKHMFGLDDSADSMTLQQWQQLLHPDDRDAALHALDAHLRGHSERYEHPHRLLHADGCFRWVLSRGTALCRATGAPYRVVGMDTDITKLKNVECVIEAIANGTAGQSGEPFFHSLVQHFARALRIDCAFITECVNRPPTRARTLAFWRGGNFDENFEYDLAGTPCDVVMREGRTVFHPSGLAQMFPREAGQESYLGLPIFARDGMVIGHLAFLDREPMPSDFVIESVYRIFTARAAVEIELSRALQRLRMVGSPALATP